MLGIYRLTPAFKTTGDGTTSRGPVSVDGFVPFSDPNGLLSADYITNGPVYARANYYPTGTQVAVDPAITRGRLRTGADFDVESIAHMNDGSFWVGEKFGPYLLHFNAQGHLIEAPVRHPVLRAPQNPQNVAPGAGNLPSSRGFEAMTVNADGSKLYVTTEASILSETDKRMLDIFEFDTAMKQYTGTAFKYAKDSSDSISGGTDNASNLFVTGDMAYVGDDKFIMIERDDFQGPPNGANPPHQKKLYLFDLGEVDEKGVLKKRLLVDLLNIADPQDIGGPLQGIAGDKFNFPLQSVESLTLVDEYTLLVGLDNNYPGGNGRLPGTPDGTEMMTLRFDVPLSTVPVLLPLPGAAWLFGSAIALGSRQRRRSVA